MSDATLKEWLSLRPSVSRFGDRGKDDDDRDDHGKDPSPRNERGEDADADVSRGGHAADTDRPGNGGDHGPAQPVLPRWLVDVETAD